jgi:hypothetical protein
MKIALITTTINVPSVLALYRRFDPSASVRFFCAVDEKTPTNAYTFLESLGNCQLVGGTDYKCDPIINWNCIQRRNLALLESLKWGAQIIVSVDDDNVPLDPNYFSQFNHLLVSRRCYDHRVAPGWSGLCAHAVNGWFDPGQFLTPPATHRGFPANIAPETYFEAVTDAKIGVAAGMVLGDPDTSAIERIAKRPDVRGVAEILKAGLVVDPKTLTVFNSQNTAIIRELAPAWSMWCGVSRYDDIMASHVVQRVMRERNLYVHFGRPFVFQQRNKHDLTRDLAGEMWGMENSESIAMELDKISLPGKSVLEDTRRLFEGIAHLVPQITTRAALAFLADCEDVL